LLDGLAKFLRAGLYSLTGPAGAGEPGVSESQTENKETQKPDLEVFSGLIEHLSRSFGSVVTVIATLPDDITNAVRDDDTLDMSKKANAIFEAGRVFQLLRFLHKFYTENFAENFLERPKNVKKLMTIMSYLAQYYWTYKDRKLSDFIELQDAISQTVAKLEEFFFDALYSAYNDDDYDDDDSDDDSS